MGSYSVGVTARA